MSQKQQRNKYVDLRTNGRLFPTWVLANFKQFKLPEILQDPDEDPCKRKTKLELKKYQLFLGKYLDPNSPYRNILLYHGLGAGKTASAIHIYNVLYNASPGINVFLLTKASLIQSTWFKELNIWLQDDDKKFRHENIFFISYDAPNSAKLFEDAVKSSDSSKKSLYIIDEAHNFIRNVYSNISSKQGRRAQSIYEYIIQDQKDNDTTRVVLLSATPAINSPFELALLFNLLRPNIFPKSETQFNQEFVSASSYRTINPAKKNMFQRRIMGLVSYYIGSTPDVFATKTIEYVDVEMNEYQEEIYTYFEKMEEEMAKKKRGPTQISETYKSYTRQSSNFVFPPMAQGISGERRPRPKDYKLTKKEGTMLEMGISLKDKEKEKYYDVQNYFDAIDNYSKLFDEYLGKINDDDERKGHTIVDDVKTYHEKYNDNYMDFHKSEKNKSDLYEEMHRCSAKFLYIIFNILKSVGPVLVYSNYVLVEGLQVFKIYLKYFGFTSLNSNLTGEDGFRYTEYHGGIDQKQRSVNINLFNDKENKYGKICKIFLISPSGSEGISLMNVRQVHIIEPFWHEVRIVQMIGRAVRLCSHKDLPIAERHVDVYRYKSVRSSGAKMTTDQYIENLAKSKEGLIQSFLDTVKEVAVDCVLNKNHNSLVNEYKCFQFDEPSLFDAQVSAAYKEDIKDDARMDNGSNSIRSQTVRIKVLKIKAVKQLNAPSENTSKVRYSKDALYWYNPETGVVYDYDLQYPVGKIGFDSDNLPIKLDKDTYVIDKVIPTPIIHESEE